MVENRKSLGILNPERPGLATVKQNNINCSTVHYEGKPDVMAVPKLPQVRESCSALQKLVTKTHKALLCHVRSIASFVSVLNSARFVTTIFPCCDPQHRSATSIVSTKLTVIPNVIPIADLIFRLVLYFFCIEPSNSQEGRSITVKTTKVS